jgi:glycosyltransferase involved in cell wall biosynthesis
MKIVFVNYNKSSQFDRPEKWLNRIKGYIGILEYLSRQYTVISIEQINFEGELFQNGVQYYFYNSKKRRSFFPWGLHRLIKKLNPDFVLVHGLHNPLQAIQLKIQLGKKVKIIAQNHAEKPFGGYKKYIQKFADNFITAYMFTSAEMGEEWVKHGVISQNEKIWEIMEASSVFTPINKEFARQRTNVKGRPVFLWVGRLDANKDPITVVKGFLQFCRHNTESRLYMIYHTTELLNKICELISKEDHNESIVLIGQVLHEEMLYWYNSADFIIAGSHYEGSGVAVCEAMSCGCIPVLTNILSFKKITGNGTCGILFERGNIASLLSALIKTKEMNMTKERDKVLEQFNAELSFTAIARQINHKLSSLSNYSVY